MPVRRPRRILERTGSEDDVSCVQRPATIRYPDERRAGRWITCPGNSAAAHRRKGRKHSG